MCSNFGINHHPDREPCAVEWTWYLFFRKWIIRARRLFSSKSLEVDPIARRNSPWRNR